MRCFGPGIFKVKKMGSRHVICVVLFILSNGYSQPGAVFASSDTQVKDILSSSHSPPPPLEAPSLRAFEKRKDLVETKPSSRVVPSASGEDTRTRHQDGDNEDVSKDFRPDLQPPKLPEEIASSERMSDSSFNSTSGEAIGDNGKLLNDGVASGISEAPHEELLPVFQEAMLVSFIKQATRQPVCVLFRPHGPVSQLERQVHKLWIKVQTSDQNWYGAWQLGAFLNQSKPTRGFSVPDNLPMLRCYIGTARPPDYRSSGPTKDLHRWLSTQFIRHRDRIPEYSDEALERLPASTELVLIVFVKAENHHDLEIMMNKLRKQYKESIQVLMVHTQSEDGRRVMRQYGIRAPPAVIVLDTKGRATVVQKFEGTQFLSEGLHTYISIRMSPISILTLDNFESRIIRPEVKRSATFVGFHAPWGRDTVSYVDALQRSAKEFHLEDGVGLDFGSVDLSQYPEVVSRWVDATYAKGVPFSVLFWWKTKDDKEEPVLHQKLFRDPVPTPWSVATFLEEHKVAILNAEGEELQYSPWEGHDIDNEVSYGFTTYSQNQCTTYANSSIVATDADYPNDMCDPSRQQQIGRSKVTNEKKRKRTRTGKSSWMKKKPNAGSVHPKIGSIPQVTDSTWSSVVERSHATRDPARLAEPWLKDVTLTTLVAFIQTDCSNCRRKLPVFERLVESLKMIDGASMFIMNCTSDPITCSQLHVIGFPTLIAFRGYGEVGSERCVSQGQATQLIRMDFHGILQEKSILEWFSEISLQAVKKLSSMTEFTQSTYQKDDVVLLATMYPLSLAGQYLPTLAGTNTWYPLECYRVACERLYGRAKCLAAVSQNLGRRDLERSKQEKEMIVTQVEMFRRDGVKSLIFSLGRNLLVTLQDESDSQIHAFHSPHRYNLREGQRCEDDVASCTDLVVEFVQDHGRLPVTHLTMSGFHTHSGTKFGEHHENSVFEHDLPVLIALASKGQLMEGAQFIDALTSAAYEFYNQMVFVSLNTDEFPKWASQFVPLGYRQKMLEYSDEITGDFIPSLNVYPRLCIVRPDDHRHAAMFPPADRFTLAPANSPRAITKTEIVRFARDFLKNGDTMMLQTEQF